MSEFLVMAATLLDIKAKMLLPAQPAAAEETEPEDPRAQLVQQLLEYKMYKYISGELKDRQLDASRVLFKAPTIPQEVSAYEEPIDLDTLVGDLTLDRLYQIFQSVMKKQADKVDPIRSKFGKIQKEEVSLEDCMASLEHHARTHKAFSFRALLGSAASKTQVIVTFLAVLELMKTGVLTIAQEHTFDDIQIRSKIAA